MGQLCQVSDVLEVSIGQRYIKLYKPEMISNLKMELLKIRKRLSSFWKLGLTKMYNPCWRMDLIIDRYDY